MRTVFQMVSGRRLYHHPSRLDRQYVLDKLLTFHQDRKTPPHEILRDLQHTAEQIPKHEQTTEAQPLQARYERAIRSRRRPTQGVGARVQPVKSCAEVGYQAERMDQAECTYANYMPDIKGYGYQQSQV